MASFRVAIYSSRSGQAGGISAMQQWLGYWSARPGMLLITGRARCNCENGEVVNETIAVSYEIEEGRFVILCKALLANLRAEVDAHLLKQGHRK